MTLEGIFPGVVVKVTKNDHSQGKKKALICI